MRLTCLAKCIVGVDLDFAALRVNPAVRYRVLAPATALPFAAETFDLVTSNMVFEHLEHPREALSEIRRIMVPGGRLIVHTPNVLDIVTIFARFTPNSLHPKLVSWVEERDQEEVYPTRYRFNSDKRISRTLAAAGFRRFEVEYLNHPNVYGHVPVLGCLEALWRGLGRRIPSLRGTLLVEAQA